MYSDIFSDILLDIFPNTLRSITSFFQTLFEAKNYFQFLYFDYVGTIIILQIWARLLQDFQIVLCAASQILYYYITHKTGGKFMLDKKVVELLNQQVNKEFYSAYLYLDFSNYYYDQGLDGFGNWYKIQAQEERDHAMLFMQYMQNNGEKVVLDAIAKPGVELASAKAVLAEGLKHEQYVTSLIHAIYDVAYSVKDFRTMQFLDWFVKEQGEEETNADNLIKKFELFGDDPKSLYMLDSELGARVYSAPSLVL